MKTLLLMLLTLFLALPAAAQSSEPAQNKVSVQTLSAGKGPLAEQLQKAAREAQKQKRPLYLELGSEWCGPCQLLDKHLETHPLLQKAFQNTMLVRLHMEHFSTEELKALNLNVAAVPCFVEIDASGKPTARRIDGNAWRSDTVEGMAPALQKFIQKTP